jgi:protein MpaA
VFADVPPPAPVVTAAAVPEGRSAQGRALRVLRRGDGGRPRVLVVGQIHGDEPVGPRVVALLAGVTPPRGTLYLVRSANPDGAARGTRTNARGVDLNRNFPGSWRPGARGRFFPGPRAGSEPETRWAMRVVRAVQPDVTVWLHQPYGLVHLTPGADRRIVRAYARRAGLPARPLPPLRGTATGWQNRTWPADSAFVVELGASNAPPPAVLRRQVSAVLGLLD